ncbi:cyclin-dependent kinase regulatory subunit [Dacryopinax primogenitus]|uniref:Cyclin-dependent kinases regulatory subunit n=1 Tax=Dacryopinax primogenitus (strain DJM 731) TaxID=1858805 RepID=M5FYA2_DACPD|nr:cyclin-dependent kinase regulatory subunit [Dacryopinax primogenitus]EJU00800.1 cyclin-dependent kinase regulatory subunit [Dacryopinax primogenitus]
MANKWEEYVERIGYSDRYSDDKFEYRHVILPKPLLKMIPKEFFAADGSGTLRLLTEAEWRGIGITQSLGWEHYEVHAPEPHVLLFRRPKNYQPPQQTVSTSAATLASGVAAGRVRAGGRK